MKPSEKNREQLEFLFRYKTLQKKMLRLTSKKAALWSMLMPGSMDYSRDKVQSSHGDRMADVQAEIDDIDKRIERLSSQVFDAYRQAVAAIEALDNDDERTILIMWFIDHKPMGYIADVIGYSRSQTYEIRNKGISHIQIGNIGQIGQIS